MILEIKNLYKAYSDEVIFEDFNLKIDTETDFALIIKGRSGKGKTTLLNILGLLDIDVKGSYFIDGVDVLNLSERKRQKYRSEFSYVFQEYFLLENETVYNNVKVPLYYTKISPFKYKELINTCIEKVGLSEYRNKKVKELSGGQRQRVSLARAIVSNPSIILLDEPTNALDTETVEEIYEIMADLVSKGTYLVIVTHDLDDIGLDNYQILDIGSSN